VARRVVAEFIGTAFLLMTVVGSGIMAERLAGGNIALALLANALATGGVLLALILTFGPISGAHFNPVVTMAFFLRDKTHWHEVLFYILAQFGGAIIGVWLAHFMFAMPVWEMSVKDRSGIHFAGSEFIATFGLLAIILTGDKLKTETVPYAVAAYIVGAYWFTSSTSFANPAVTLARAFTDSFSGICLMDVPGFLFAQITAMLFAISLFGWLLREENILHDLT
jgi:glycerol uptake facilitator-like aquaporin